MWRAVLHARVVSMEMLSINVGEAVRIYLDRVLPAAREQEGFRGAWMLSDPDTGEGLSISRERAALRHCRVGGRDRHTQDNYHDSAKLGQYLVFVKPEEALLLGPHLLDVDLVVASVYVLMNSI